MYCPKCGQQQIADNTNFCSRCGLPISEVARWLEQGENPVLRDKSQLMPTRRRRNIKRGAKLMFISGVLFPILLVSSLIFDNPAPLLISFLLFFIGLAIMLYSRLFIEKDSPLSPAQALPGKLNSMLNNKSLPHANRFWTTNAGREPVKTAEMVKPPSVTEHTTTLLGNDKS